MIWSAWIIYYYNLSLLWLFLLLKLNKWFIRNCCFSGIWLAQRLFLIGSINYFCHFFVWVSRINVGINIYNLNLTHKLWINNIYVNDCNLNFVLFSFYIQLHDNLFFIAVSYYINIKFLNFIYYYFLMYKLNILLLLLYLHDFNWKTQCIAQIICS